MYAVLNLNGRLGLIKMRTWQTEDARLQMETALELATVYKLRFLVITCKLGLCKYRTGQWEVLPRRDGRQLHGSRAGCLRLLEATYA